MLRKLIVTEQEDDIEFSVTLEAMDYWRCLKDFMQWIRDQDKYAAEPPTIGEVREYLHELIIEHGLTDI